MQADEVESAEFLHSDGIVWRQRRKLRHPTNIIRHNAAIRAVNAWSCRRLLTLKGIGHVLAGKIICFRRGDGLQSRRLHHLGELLELEGFSPPILTNLVLNIQPAPPHSAHQHHGAPHSNGPEQTLPARAAEHPQPSLWDPTAWPALSRRLHDPHQLPSTTTPTPAGAGAGANRPPAGATALPPPAASPAAAPPLTAAACPPAAAPPPPAAARPPSAVPPPPAAARPPAA
jgi:hypothetical protein